MGHIRVNCQESIRAPVSTAPLAPNVREEEHPVNGVYKTGSSFNSTDGLIVEGKIEGTDCAITI